MTQSPHIPGWTRVALLLIIAAGASWILTLPYFHSPMSNRSVDMLLTTAIFISAGFAFVLARPMHRVAVVIGVILAAILLYAYAPLIARHYVSFLVGVLVCAIFGGLPAPSGSRTMAEAWRTVRNHPDDESRRFAAFATKRRLFSRLDQPDK